MSRLMCHMVKDLKVNQVTKRTQSVTLTGCHKGLKVVETYTFNSKRLKCVEIIEQRDHKGVFLNPEDSVNAFFEAKFESVN